jgi:hypothetical protein
LSVNNFDVLKRMAAENKDIMLGTDVLNAMGTKKGTQLTIGIGAQIVERLALNEVKACLIVYDVSQFNNLKMRMEKEDADAKP